jgi:CRP-like cAMP-binding protein
MLDQNLDLNRFRTLVPIETLDEAKIRFLAQQAEMAHYKKGEAIFQQGDNDAQTLYLMAGEIRLTAADGQGTLVRAGTDQAAHALANLKPRRFSAQVLSREALIVKLDTQTLDQALTLDQLSEADSGMEVKEFEGPDAFDSEWMMSLLQAPSFLKMPAANIQELFARLEEQEVAAGETIIRQGETGDYFYLIKKGVAQVSRKVGASNKVFAELKAPQGFGEEALLTESPRNATVSMKTDGVLMRLSKQDFRFLMQASLVKEVNLGEASRLVKGGAVRVDVRSEREFAQGSLKGSTNIPLFLLRLKIKSLDKKQTYVLFCDNGSRSAAAAFLMGEAGFDVHVLKGGLATALKEVKQTTQSQ